MAKDWVQETVANWREWAGVHRRHSGHDIADTFEACAEELEAIWNESLTICDAARESGYSPEEIFDLVIVQTIPNAGQFHHPRLLRRDIPIKPGTNKHLRASDDGQGGLP